MTAIILDGKNLAHISEDSIKNEVSDLKIKALTQHLQQFLLAVIPPLRHMFE